MAKLRTMESLKPMQALWLDNFLLSGNAAESARKAGYSVISSRQQGMLLKKKLANLIVERGYDSIASLMPKAITTLGECLSDRNGMVRMQAVKEVLGISGIAGIERKEVTITHKTETEIDAELTKLLNRNKDIINVVPVKDDK